MKFTLDHDKLIFLDAEALAEGGIRSACKSILPLLRQFVAEPAEVVESADPSAPYYLVKCRDVDYPYLLTGTARRRRAEPGGASDLRIR